MPFSLTKAVEIGIIIYWKFIVALRPIGAIKNGMDVIKYIKRKISLVL